YHELCIFVLVSLLLYLSLVHLFQYNFFFFSSRRRHTRFSRDWSSDVALPIYVGYRPITVVWYRTHGVLVVKQLCFSTVSGHNRRSEERRVGKECRCRMLP